MTDLDLIFEYFPELEEIPTTKLQACRQRVVNYLRPHFPDHEMSPGSTFGDMFVTPAAAWLAAAETAHGRFMSDLDLENVSNGVIFSCAFVERYLGNFAVKDTSTLQSSGLVRLTFSENKEYTLNKGVQFGFGTPDIFYPRPPFSEVPDFTILAAGSIPSPGNNQLVLVQTSLTTWAVDVPLTGKMTEPVLRGTAGLSSAVPPELVGVAAAVTFDEGLPPLSLSALAKMARRLAYSVGLNSRGNTRAFVRQQWPETSAVSVVANGDAEMQRTFASSAIVLQPPAADVYFRSIRDFQVETQVVRLAWNVTLGVFRGKVAFLHRPSIIDLVRWSGNTSMELSGFKLYSQVTDTALPGSTGCGSTKEIFWLEVTPPLSDDDVILVPRSEDADGLYAMFSITYRGDPLLGPVSASLQSPDNEPIGVSLVTKSGPLVVISDLTVRYRRAPGTTMLLETARTEIAAYVNNVGYPDLYSEAPIIESMYNAGASRVQDIFYQAVLGVTPAVRRFSATANPAALEDWDASGVSLACPAIEIDDAAGMRPAITAATTINGVPELYAVTDRNVRYFVEPERITFVEL